MIFLQQQLKQSAFSYTFPQWWAFYLFIEEFFAAYNIGGAKELVVLLWLSGDI